MERIDGRKWDEIRPVTICSHVNPYAEGSVEVSFGNTKVLVAVSVETGIPRWKEPGSGGWITAEYGMLPRATHSRNNREASSGRQGGRTIEIQRLIGRSLRQATVLEELPDLTFRIDADVLVADGGTRTAAITGAWVALAHAFSWAKRHDHLPDSVQLTPVTAVSVGAVQGSLLTDLCYQEDSQADFDCNIVATGADELVEVQGTGEASAIPLGKFGELMELGLSSIRAIRELQLQAVTDNP